jgi:hypothetical protein
MAKWIPVLKTGTHKGKDATGAEASVSFDAARLDRIVNSYNPAKNETPLVIGHPKSDDPAFGWVDKFKRVGEMLYALPKKVVPEFADAVNKGMYQYVSCKVRPDDTIRHIGFLGAQPPAVKGLGIVTLSESDEGDTVELSEVELSEADLYVEKSLFRRIGGFMQRLRDSVIEKEGIEAADKVIGSDDITYFNQSIDSLEKQDTPADTPISFCEPDSGKGENAMSKELQAALDAANARATELSEANTALVATNTALTQQVNALNASIAAAAKDSRTVQFSEFCDAQIGAGKLLAADKPAIIEIMHTLSDKGEIEFSEADGTKSKKPAIDYLKSLITLHKPSVEFAEVATGDNSVEATELSEAEGLAKEMTTFIDTEAAAGRTVNVAEALAHVKKTRA